MSFPTAPVNGQTATVNGITYIYNATNNAWKRQTIDSIVVSSLTTQLATVNDISVAGNATVNDISVSGNATVNDISIPGTATVNNLSITGSVIGNTVIGSFYTYFKRVTVDFGNTMVYNRTVYISDDRAQIGARVFVTPTAFTTNAQVILGNDDLEFDNFMCTANVITTGNIAVYISSYPGPVKGQRNFDYILG